MSWDIVNADCLGSDGMPSLLARSVDVIITDPPYSAHVHSKSRRGLTQDNRTMAKEARRRIREGGEWLPGDISERRDLGFESLTQAVMGAAADQFARTVRRWVLVFCDIESAHLWRWFLTTETCRSCGGRGYGELVFGGPHRLRVMCAECDGEGRLPSDRLEYVRIPAWHKIGGAPQFTGDRPAVWGEAIVCCHPKGRKRWNGGGKQGLYSVPTAIDRDRSSLDERMHTTQKPVALMEALIRDFTDPGETILDGFAGSGTTLLAATRLGRHSIGYEKDPTEHAKALRRLQGEKQLPDGFLDERQGALFGGGQ